jgi:hypothetical protein
MGDGRVFSDSDSLGDARAWLREQVTTGGASCPCCRQFAKIYRRRLHSGMARALVLMYRAHGCDWQDKTQTLRGVGSAARDESLLRFWGLIEEDPRRREDGGRMGWWRVTEAGANFVEGRTRAASHVVVYNGSKIRLDAEKTISIREALGENFNYDELMA